jgi:hypothetical protein
VAVTVALLLIVLIIMSALVVDMGYWYSVRRQLQAAADAAALAGCRDLANGASDQEIWDTVTAYADENAVTPVDNLAVVDPSPGGDSDIGDDFVKVTVSSDAVGFFARALGRNTNMIRAQSVARLDYLVGAQTPVPWALPILQVTRMVARADGIEYTMSEGADGHWSGWLPSGSTGTIDVIAYNDQTLDPSYPDGVPEEIGPVQRIIYLPSTSLFADVRIPQQTFTYDSGVAQTVLVEVDLKAPLAGGESVQVEFGNKKYAASAVDSDTYVASFSADVLFDKNSDNLWSTQSIEVSIVQGNKDVEVLPGKPILVVRRSTYPMKDIAVDTFVFASGSLGPVPVEVDLNTYEYGERYSMKVVGGDGENGNFMAIDFHTILHEPYWQFPQDPVEYPDLPSGTNVYYDYIAGTAPYDFIMHVGDTVWTEPGNMSGPQTRRALEERFGGEAADYDAWIDAGMPPTNRLVFVPITEKIQDANGTTPLKVVSFAALYVEDIEYTGSQGNALVHGRFAPYTGPGWIVSPDPPDSPLVIRAPHLVAEGVDF